MTEIELNKLEAMADAATSGPWDVGEDGPILYEGMLRPVWNIYGGKNFIDARLVGSVEHFKEDGYPNANAAFIAAANPATIKSLIASAREAVAEIERLRSALTDLLNAEFSPSLLSAPDATVRGRLGHNDRTEAMIKARAALSARAAQMDGEG